MTSVHNVHEELILPSRSIFSLLILLIVAYISYGGFYRLWLSPIAKFPGPRFAALTFWYEFYYDVVQGGRYTWKLDELHKKYGPIIRINPFELHIKDPDFYKSIYVGSTKGKTEKWAWAGTGFGDSNASIATIDHDLHRVRRSAFASYFSKASISAREPTIQATVHRLIHRLEKYQATGQPVDLTHAYTALTCDIISKFCFGEPYNLCEAPDFGRQLHDAMVSSIRMAPLIVQFPWILTILNSLPLWLAKRLSPEASTLLQMQADWANQVQAVLAEPSSATTDKNIFHAILDADIPEAEKSTKRLNSEAQVMIGAGTLTTSHTLATTTYYLLANPPTLTRLISELNAANADLSQPLSLAELEQIPYLTAVMFEGLRISYGVSHRLQRIARDRTIKYHNWIIPAGTPVGLTAVHIHDDPDIFPNPREFLPERWLPLETTGLRLQEYLVSFSKGTRNCAGMNLAYAEFRVALAAVIRRFGGQMELWDVVKERDVDAVTDAFAPLPTKAGRGIRVVL